MAKGKFKKLAMLLVTTTVVLSSLSPAMAQGNEGNNAPEKIEKFKDPKKMSKKEFESYFGEGSKLVEDTIVLASSQKFQKSETGNYIIQFYDPQKGTKEIEESKGRLVTEFGPEDAKNFVVEFNYGQAKQFFKNTNIIFMEPDEEIEKTSVYPEINPGANNAQIGTHNAAKAHLSGISGEGVDVLVLDDGIHGSNQYVAHNLVGWSQYPGVSAGNTSQPDSHGTLASSAISGKDKFNRPTGVAPDVNLYHYKMVESGGAAHSKIAAGVYWGIDQGVDVINVSYRASPSTIRTNAYKAAFDKGIAVFNSAGNQGELIEKEDPTCLYAVCVGAINTSNNRIVTASNWSSAYGAGVDFSAAGQNTFVAKYATGEPVSYPGGGTSFASPVAAGIYALYKSENPNLNMEQILELMKTNSKPVDTAGKVFPNKVWYEAPNVLTTFVIGNTFTPIKGVTISKSETTVYHELLIKTSKITNGNIASVKWNPSNGVPQEIRNARINHIGGSNEAMDLQGIKDKNMTNGKGFISVTTIESGKISITNTPVFTLAP